MNKKKKKKKKSKFIATNEILTEMVNGLILVPGYD